MCCLGQTFAPYIIYVCGILFIKKKINETPFKVFEITPEMYNITNAKYFIV